VLLCRYDVVVYCCVIRQVGLFPLRLFFERLFNVMGSLHLSVVLAYRQERVCGSSWEIYIVCLSFLFCMSTTVCDHKEFYIGNDFYFLFCFLFIKKS